MKSFGGRDQILRALTYAVDESLDGNTIHTLRRSLKWWPESVIPLVGKWKQAEPTEFTREPV